MPALLHLAEPAGGGARPRQEPIRVVLADDHAVVRRSLRQLLEGEPDVEVVAEASDLASAMRYAETSRPDVVVLGLQRQMGAQIEAIEQLRRRASSIAVVAMSMEESPLSACQALDAGAAAFVLKDHADSELRSAIRCAARGDEYVSDRVTGGLDALRLASAGSVLNRRETEVLRLIALGHTSAEIANVTHLSRRTIETHRARIYEKLELRTRAELVRFALRSKLIGV